MPLVRRLQLQGRLKMSVGRFAAKCVNVIR